MRVLTEDAVLLCLHVKGEVRLTTTQTLVRIDGRIVLVDDNPEGRPIKGCPNIGPMIRPCQTTLTVKAGYSDLLRIDGRRVCLDTVRGLTDGTPPGIVEYRVSEPGQVFVAEQEP